MSFDSRCAYVGADHRPGSYAWCLADRTNCQNAIYGARTWTDGPVAVSYLADLLNVPLTSDWAVGHADGGSKAGASIDNAYTPSPAGAPSAKDQIANYTRHPDALHAGDALHFLWIGNNDITLPHVWDPAHFAGNMSARMADRVQELVAAGAKHIFVVNMYPKQITPAAWAFLLDTQKQADDMGAAISDANDAVAAALKPFGDTVIYYDVFSFVVELQKNAAAHGFTHASHDEFCDGDGTQAHWDECIATHGATFFWINYVEMTSPAYKLIAEDMAKVVKAHFAP